MAARQQGVRSYFAGEVLFSQVTHGARFGRSGVSRPLRGRFGADPRALCPQTAVRRPGRRVFPPVLVRSPQAGLAARAVEIAAAGATASSVLTLSARIRRRPATREAAGSACCGARSKPFSTATAATGPCTWSCTRATLGFPRWTFFPAPRCVRAIPRCAPSGRQRSSAHTPPPRRPVSLQPRPPAGRAHRVCLPAAAPPRGGRAVAAVHHAGPEPRLHGAGGGGAVEVLPPRVRGHDGVRVLVPHRAPGGGHGHLLHALPHHQHRALPAGALPRDRAALTPRPCAQDMLSRVRERRPDHNNATSVASSSVASSAKLACAPQPAKHT